MLYLFKHELFSRWSAVLGWGIGLGAFGVMYTSIFPQVADEVSLLADLQIYAALGIDLTSFEAFIASTTIQFVPILLGIYAIITSTATLAGEEDDGTLETLVAMPIARWQIVTAKAAAIAVALALTLLLAGLINAPVLAAVSQTVEVDVAPGQLIAVVLSGWPIVLAFTMIGLFLSALLPTRRAASLTLAVLFIASYFAENLSGMVSSLEAIKPFSLFTYFDSSADVFREGVRAGDAAVLLAVAVVFFGLALWAFHRRDLTVGAWPWQRPQPES
ncbi:MAG: ABC transporter permease subunit [Anaerolineae bacterium]